MTYRPCRSTIHRSAPHPTRARHVLRSRARVPHRAAPLPPRTSFAPLASGASSRLRRERRGRRSRCDARTRHRSRGMTSFDTPIQRVTVTTFFAVRVAIASTYGLASSLDDIDCELEVPWRNSGSADRYRSRPLRMGSMTQRHRGVRRIPKIEHETRPPAGYQASGAQWTAGNGNLRWRGATAQHTPDPAAHQQAMDGSSRWPIRGVDGHRRAYGAGRHHLCVRRGCICPQAPGRSQGWNLKLSGSCLIGMFATSVE